MASVLAAVYVNLPKSIAMTYHEKNKSAFVE